MINNEQTLNSIDDLNDRMNFLRSVNYYDLDNKNRNAVFDLDNTLLEGDIGDAVFSMLKIMGMNKKLSWKEYIKILENEGKEVAYSKVVSAMSGLSIDTIKKATEKILICDDKELTVEGITVPVPKPHPVMSAFIRLLKEHEFNIYVISATNIFSVRYTCDHLFKIPENNCFGIEPETIDISNRNLIETVLTEKIKTPLTITTGKEALYWEKISKFRPLITAGDSETDIFLLNLVDPNGFSIWIGNNKKKYYSIRKRSTIPDKFFYFKR